MNVLISARSNVSLTCFGKSAVTHVTPHFVCCIWKPLPDIIIPGLLLIWSTLATIALPETNGVIKSIAIERNLANRSSNCFGTFNVNNERCLFVDCVR